MAERLDWGFTQALEDQTVGPQLRDLFAEGEGREFLPPRILNYFAFYEKYKDRLGENGSSQNGEIEILTNPIDIFAAEKAGIGQLTRQGLSEEEAAKRIQVGVRNESRWGASVCDAVRFPGGALGTYVREISWQQLEQGVDGIAVIPVLEDGRIVMVKNYRHATRRWTLQIPRGGTEPEGVAATIKRELSEEAGVEIIGNPQLIGHDTPDDGILASKVPVYFATVRILGQPIPEESEAIGGLVIMTKYELNEALIAGQHTVEGKTYDLSDSFTQTSFAQAVNQELL